jgi:hypothetical protein
LALVQAVAGVAFLFCVVFIISVVKIDVVIDYVTLCFFQVLMFDCSEK